MRQDLTDRVDGTEPADHEGMEEAELRGRFNKIDTRLKDVDERFDRVDGRFAEVDARFDKVDVDFSDMRRLILDEGKRTRSHFDAVAERLESRIALIGKVMKS